MAQVSISKRLEIVIYENWDLDQLEGEFEVAAFEREVRKSHVDEIALAIMEGRLFDPVISVMARKNDREPFEVIDGQHRLEGLKKLRDEGKISKYTFAVKILHGEDARLAYRMLNSGKPLTLDDILKSYDDGSVQVFNKLNQFCVFYSTSENKLPFSLIIKGHYYGSTKMMRTGGHRDRVIKLALTMSAKDIEAMHSMLSLMQSALGGSLLKKSPVSKMVIFLTICRMFSQNNDGIPKFSQHFIHFIKALSKDKEVAELSKQGRGIMQLEKADELLKGIWNAS